MNGQWLDHSVCSTYNIINTRKSHTESFREFFHISPNLIGLLCNILFKECLLIETLSTFEQGFFISRKPKFTQLFHAYFIEVCSLGLNILMADSDSTE
jgi:hypothetical protein